MKLTLQQIFDMMDPLNKLVALDIPIRAAYKLSKLAKKLNEEYKTVEEYRIDLVKKYGVEAEGGNITVSGDENILAFRVEFSQLLSEEVDIDFEPIPISELGSNCNFTPSEMVQLGVFFTD